MNEITTINESRALELYSTENGLNPILDKIKSEVDAIEVDATTEEGQNKIKSVAYKIAKSKTLLDNLGKSLTNDWAKKKKLVDAERKRVREFLDNLKEEFRKPITDLENAEKERIANIKSKIEHIQSYSLITNEHSIKYTTKELENFLQELEKIKIDESYQEFMYDATIYKADSMGSLKHEIEDSLGRDEIAQKKDEEEKSKKIQLEKEKEHTENLAIKELINYGLNSDCASTLVEAIVNKEIKNLLINY